VIPYRVNFENLGPVSVTPSQPAYGAGSASCDYRSTLHDLDLDTLRLTGFGFGESYFSISEDRQFHFAIVSMTYNNETFDVEVELRFDSTKGMLSVVFDSVDPATNLPPDVLTGFLLPRMELESASVTLLLPFCPAPICQLERKSAMSLASVLMDRSSQRTKETRKMHPLAQIQPKRHCTRLMLDYQPAISSP
jgi:hypothetical protein